MALTSGFVLYTFYVVFAFRLLTVIISARRERRLKNIGAVEYGKGNSAILVAAHVLYYIACMFEGFGKGAFFTDAVSIAGLVVYVFSIAVLYYVIWSLRHIWTVKLIIAPKEYHTLNVSPLFRLVRHPNYFLNIVPELIGTALVFHAWYTLAIGGTLYLIPLVIRITQEEKVMKQHFKAY
jgi:isoprenylcysteine carboxyl methyltransferase (ICMT) family protein YpbQ